MIRSARATFAFVLTACLAVGHARAADVEVGPGRPVQPGEPGGPGLALRAAKILTVEREGPGFVDRGVCLVRDGRIERVGPASDVEVPDGYVEVDLGERWLMPGMIDLHTHVAGSRDINDAVLQTNAGLRVSTSVRPRNPNMWRQVMAGVTTVLFIPGSATNIGGQGILLKTGAERFEDMRVRDPGSLKVAQGDNPTRWGYGMGRSMMNFHIRTVTRRGLAYAKAWLEAEAGERETPRRLVHLDVYRELAAKRTQISTHTQVTQLVMMTIMMLKGEFDLDVYIDHGEWAGFLMAPLAESMGVAAIIGPREIDWPGSSRYDTDGRVLSASAEYQKRGLKQIGFNTDAPVVPGEEYALQATMGVRYGFDNSRMDAVRGMTIIPAQTAGIDHRVGSLEPGKDADLVVLDGDPLDPRNAVRAVYLEGRRIYTAGEAGTVRRW